MAPRKTERILNLTISLLVTRQFLPKSRIREVVEGYHDLSDAAFERTFERDKDELRRLGIPVHVGNFDPYFDDEPGYRILRSDFELPPIELDAEEAAVLGVAARAWQHASLASSTRSALAKLRAAGVEPRADNLAGLEPSLAANEAAFEPLWHAVLDRVRVSFTYRRSDGSGAETRTLEPWGITSFHGHWYVVGQDTDRRATRMFRLSRMRSVPQSVSKPGAYQVPDDLDLRRLARSLSPDRPTADAVVAIRPGRAPALRRQATPVAGPPLNAVEEHAGEGHAGQGHAGQGHAGDGNAGDGNAGDGNAGVRAPEGFEVVSIGYADRGSLADDVARYAADVVVLQPADLREAVIRRLQAVVATAQPEEQDTAAGVGSTAGDGSAAGDGSTAGDGR